MTVDDVVASLSIQFVVSIGPVHRVVAVACADGGVGTVECTNNIVPRGHNQNRLADRFITQRAAVSKLNAVYPSRMVEVVVGKKCLNRDLVAGAFDA